MSMGWNNAMYAALLIAPPSVAAKISPLDQEVDRLCDLAVARTWARSEFRRERAELGRMATDYLRSARSLAGLPDIALPSIWTWYPGKDEQLPVPPHGGWSGQLMPLDFAARPG